MNVSVAIQQGDTWLWFVTSQSPAPAPLTWQWLVNVGTIRASARTSYLGGIGESESPSVTVTISNRGAQAAQLLGGLLRRRAKVVTSDGSILFQGVITKITYGLELSLEVEA